MSGQRKTGPTPKQRPGRRYRLVTADVLARMTRVVPSMHCLDMDAVGDALKRCCYEVLEAIAADTDVQSLCTWMDFLADANPDDARWGDWRNYRGYLVSHAN